MPISTQQVSGWARTVQHPQTPSPMLFPDNGLLLTLLLLQVCSRALCLRIFFLSWETSTDACLLVLRSIHAAISAENTQGPGVQKSHTKVVSVSSAWELSPCTLSYPAPPFPSSGNCGSYKPSRACILVLQAKKHHFLEIEGLLESIQILHQRVHFTNGKNFCPGLL